MMGKLKPCPFCGGINLSEFTQRLNTEREVFMLTLSCKECSLAVQTIDPDISKLQALAHRRWNTRPSPWRTDMENAPLYVELVLHTLQGRDVKAKRVGEDWIEYFIDDYGNEVDDVTHWQPITLPEEVTV